MEEIQVIYLNWDDYVKYILINSICSITIMIDNKLAYIYSLYVDPSYRNKGIATKLLDKAEQMIRDLGINKAYIGYNMYRHPVYIPYMYFKKGYKQFYKVEDDVMWLVKNL